MIYFTGRRSPVPRCLSLFHGIYTQDMEKVQHEGCLQGLCYPKIMDKELVLGRKVLQARLQ